MREDDEVSILKARYRPTMGRGGDDNMAVIQIHQPPINRHHEDDRCTARRLSDATAVDCYANNNYLSPEKPSKRHQQQPSIDIKKCKRKASLYGDQHRRQQPQTSPCSEQHVTFFHPETGRVHAKSVQDLQRQNLLTKENYWIDIEAPSIAEMKIISKVFRIHPLTIEDIVSQETREKCDVFRQYLFVSYRAFVVCTAEDNTLRPISIYSIVHKNSILTFHYSSVEPLEHVYQRVEQLQHYIVVAPDWINYAILDEITDHFAPMIQEIEAEVEAIDDPALLLKVNDDETDMVMRIGSCRKRVMQMLRFLSSKADVVRALIKRGGTGDDSCQQLVVRHRRNGSASSLGYVMKDKNSPRYNGLGDEEEDEQDDGKIYPDVALYLGDVQDHLITMLQNLSHYETVLARAHSNYLAQISIKLSQTSNSTNHVIGRLTVFATILLPMNIVTGLWGMNVKVPGKDYDDLLYFFWIVISLAVFAIAAFTFARWFRFF